MEDNYEVEYKCQLKDRNVLNTTIKKSKKISKKTIVDRYYDTKTCTLLKKGIIIRLRNFDSIDIKYNEKSTRREFSIPLEEVPDSKQELNLILSEIGLRTITNPSLMNILIENDLVEMGVLHKDRDSYDHNGVRIDIDKVQELGNFVEFEILTNDEDKIELAKKKINKLMKELKLKPLKENYVKMLLNKIKKINKNKKTNNKTNKKIKKESNDYI